MSEPETLIGWIRYYRQVAEDIRAKNPSISRNVLKLHLQREYGFRGLALDAVIDRMYEARS